jgi:hypothetical protein
VAVGHHDFSVGRPKNRQTIETSTKGLSNWAALLVDRYRCDAEAKPAIETAQDFGASNL